MSQPDMGKTEARYTRNATIVGVALVVIMGLSFAYDLATGNNGLISLSITAAVGIVAVISVWMSRHGRTTQGIILISGTILIIMPVAVLAIEGIGLVTSVVGVIIVTSIAVVTLPQAYTFRILLISFAVGIATLVLDLFGPTNRLETSDATSSNGIAIILLLVFSFFVLRQFPNFSLRAKLITATAMVAVVAVITVTAIVGITTRNALVSQVGTNLNSLAELQALGVGELLTRQVNVLETLALNREVSDAVEARNVFYQDKSPEEIQASVLQLSEEWRTAEATDRLILGVMNNTTSQEMVRFRQTFPDHARLLLADRNGALVAASERPTKFDFSNEGWWIDGYSIGFGSVYVSDPYIDDKLNTVLVDIAVPVRAQGSSGRSPIGGVLLTSFDLSNALTSVLAGTQLGEATHFDLHFDNFRQMELAEGTTNELVFISPQESQIVQQLQSSALPFVNSLFHGIPSLTSQARVNTQANEPGVDQLGWRVVLSQPEEVALQPVQAQQRINIILGVVIVVAASITAAIIAQLLARPIVRLSNTAVQVAEGDLSARAPVESNDEIGTLAVNFNRMTSQLQESIEGLEQRVAERTRALSASVEVSRSLSTILNPDQLVIEVVEQVRAAFGYYYVQIYLFDEAHTMLQMVGGTGEAGQVLLARGHALAAGQGLVGQAAATNTPVFIPDVAETAGWKSNPLLPDTKAEISVPIAISDQVIGVLDVQHDVMGSLTEEDVRLLQSLAFQVAIAIQNAGSYDAARKRAEREATINAINQRIQNATSVDDVLRIATAELGRALNKHKASVQLHNPVHSGNGRTSQGKN